MNCGDVRRDWIQRLQNHVSYMNEAFCILSVHQKKKANFKMCFLNLHITEKDEKLNFHFA